MNSPSDLALLIAEQAADDARQRVSPERAADGRRVANATDLELNWQQTTSARWVRDLERLDDSIDRGTVILWVDDPCARWLGEAAEEAMYGGMVVFDAGGRPVSRVPFPCPICEDSRPRKQTCPYCLRRGADRRLPLRKPPAHLARALEPRPLAERRAKQKAKKAG